VFAYVAGSGDARTLRTIAVSCAEQAGGGGL